MTELSPQYQEKAEREQAAANREKKRIAAINAKRYMTLPSGHNFDGRTTREVAETRSLEKKR